MMRRFIGLALVCFAGWEIQIYALAEAIAQSDSAVACPSQSSALELFAAREVRRYLYLRTGVCLPVETIENFAAERRGGFIVCRKDCEILQHLPLTQELRSEIADLSEQAYRIKTISEDLRTFVLVCGGGNAGTLYGSYRLMECLGVRFYLDGDVVPDERIPLAIPDVDERGAPLFELRGILPFHDFPEGPDWWNVDDYKSVLAQLAKLKMNFIGLHAYLSEDVEKGWCEPTIWIGPPQDVKTNGKVTFAYKSGYVTTHRGMDFDGVVKDTSEFLFGASQLFADDFYGPDFMQGNIPLPKTPGDSVELFNRHGRMFREAFEHAHDLEIKTCIGSNTPPAIPNSLKEHLQTLGKDPNDPRLKQELYEGVFTRAARAHPLDYYWFWTHEGWLGGAKEEEIEAVKDDWFSGIAAARATGAPFTLATCGWVLGPPEDRSLFDKWLPKEMPVSCISRSLGVEPVDATFASIEGRSKWSIPWIEDDSAMISLQLWAGRMRADAADSLKYGCDGLMGIHWRTKCIGPTLTALAQAAWVQGEWAAEPQPVSGQDKSNPQNRFRPVYDFYLDWAGHHFGENVAEPAANLFSRIDGKLPRPSTWVHGPGVLFPESRPWEEVRKEYAFVDEFASLRSAIKGSGNLSRFEYWLNTLRFLEAQAKVDCAWGEYNRALEKVKAIDDPHERRRSARQRLMPVRIHLMKCLEELYRYFLGTVNTPGELGTLSNIEQRSLPLLLDGPAKEFVEILGVPLPKAALPRKDYDGPPRVIVPTVRTTAAPGEMMTLKVLLLDRGKPRKAVLYWRRMGQGDFNAVPLQYRNRGVYTVQFPPEGIRGMDIEYYIEVKPSHGGTVYFPATAPDINQTVVILRSES